MYEYFKNISEKSSCRLNGVCSIHPSINALYRILLNELREISFYVVKLKEFGLINKDIMALSIEGLSIFLINTNFNKANYLSLIQKLYDTKNKVKEKYTNYCNENHVPCEIIDSRIEIKKNSTISELIELSQTYIQNRQIQDNIKLGLFELITLFSRISAINVVKLKKLSKGYDDFDYDILRFFALTGGYSIRNEKLIRRIKEFSKILLKIKTEFLKVTIQKYGDIENTRIKTNLSKGHSILISGDDLDELEKLLRTIEKADLKETVNVYTNGPLLKAHFYSYFKTNKYLKGHIDTNNAEYDFSSFQGAILITQNFIQKIDSLYRGEIFSNKIISFEKVTDIKDNDYMPVVDCALKLKTVEFDEKDSFLDDEYNENKILKETNNIKDENVIFIFGTKDKIPDNIENKKILQIKLPIKIDNLIQAIDKLKKANKKITLFFTRCDLAMLEIILCFLDEDIDLNLVNCPYSLINPHVIEALKEHFKVVMI